MKTIMIKSKVEGNVIRRPDTKQKLSPKGEMVPDNNFWRRRLLEGDVVLVENEETADVETAKVETTTKDVEAKKSGVKSDFV